MAFEANEGHYSSLVSCTVSWLKQMGLKLLKKALRLFATLDLCFTRATTLLFILSRIYIVVESFISLRHVHTGVYVGVEVYPSLVI